ncbi:MAG: class I SAM-dependent methyltransferase [Actinomycetota bacterium]
MGRLRRRILESGPITFADFMEAALYDPEHGFYARSPIGAGGHFVTSPHVSPAFGSLVARQLAECWENLGRPHPFWVVELGAGDGTLARQVIASSEAVEELSQALRYLAVERTPGQSEALRDAGIETLRSLAEKATLTGCVIANELLDNVPFHRIRTRNGKLVEVLVGVDGDRLVELEGDPTRAALGAMSSPPLEGEERAASPQALAIIGEIATILERGYAFLFDYGYRKGEPPGPVHSYQSHHILADVLEDPGSRDVTAAVDLEAVAEAARPSIQVWGPVTQRDALLALGYRMWDAGVRKRQTESEDALEATRMFEARSKASILIDEDKLGGLYLLAFGTEGLPPPASVLDDKQTGC